MRFLVERMNKFDNGENAYEGFDTQEKEIKTFELAELVARLESLGGEPPSLFKSFNLKSTKWKQTTK